MLQPPTNNNPATGGEEGGNNEDDLEVLMVRNPTDPQSQGIMVQNKFQYHIDNEYFYHVIMH